MNKRQMFGWLVVLIAIVATFGYTCSHAQDSGELLTEAPASVRCYGRVLDDKGNPLENARVTLIAPHGVAYVITAKIGSDPAVLEVVTNMEGEFSLEFSSDDLRFLGASPFVLMVQADGFATDAVEVPMNRLLVDLPHEKTMVRCQPVRLRIRDTDGKPAAGTKVRVARIGKLLLPFQLENNGMLESDAEGNVTIDECGSESLRSIYVQSESAGNQLIPVQTNGQEHVATIMATGQVNGQIELPDGADASMLALRKALVSSSQSSEFAIDGPRSVSWQMVTVDGQGKFVADRIAPGTLRFQFIERNGLLIALQMDALLKFTELTEKNSPLDWKLPFKPAREYVFKFVGENGEPLPRLSFSLGGLAEFGSIPEMTNENGEYSMTFPVDEKPDGQMFPQDAFGRISMEAFGTDISRLKFSEDGTPEPIQLASSRSLIGRVIDENGSNVAGATVEYSYGQERFNRTEKTWTDNSGRFEIRGLPPNAAVEVTARKGAAMTNSNQAANVVAGTRDEVTLVLVEQPTAALVGRVVDPNGKPVHGANVAINRISVMVEESYGAEETAGVPWSADLPTVTSDADGAFHYPATPGFGDRIQINIQADGFLPFRDPFVLGSRQQLIDGQLRLGEFHLLPVPPKVNATVRCVDQSTGEPVAGAEIVFIGAQAGRTSSTTGENGSVAMTLADTAQIAAVRAEGYSILFEQVNHVGESVEFKLQKTDVDMTNQRLAWFDRQRNDYLDAAKPLLVQLEKPLPGESTWYRQSQYFSALAVIDPDAFRKSMTDPDVAYEDKDTIILFQLEGIAKRSPRQAVEFLAASKIELPQKAALLARIAALSPDSELKDELYGEAIVALGALSGSDLLMATGFVAQSLIIDGRIPAAKSIVQTAWDAADEYRNLLKEGKQKNALGEARRFGPVLAIIDPDAALRLIPLLAVQQEVDSLKDQALGALSLCDWEQFMAVCNERKLKYAGGGADWVLAADSAADGNPALVEWAIKTVDVLDDSTTRMALCLFAAKHLPPGSERDRLLATAIHAWEAAEVSFWYHWSDPAKFALEQLVSFDTIQPHELDQLIFTCLNKAPATFESMNLIGVLGDAARLLGMRDAKLGRALLEPAFDDTVWLFDHVGRTWFDKNVALNSTVWIDPAWAGKLAQQFSDRYSPDDPVRQLQIFGSIIAEMETLVSR